MTPLHATHPHSLDQDCWADSSAHNQALCVASAIHWTGGRKKQKFKVWLAIHYIMSIPVWRDQTHLDPC